MAAKAAMAPAKTVSRGCLMAIMAAMKKVLSPNSETIITEKEATKAWKKPTPPSTSPVVLGTCTQIVIFTQCCLPRPSYCFTMA